ncbi:SdpI family protein [Bifidobacterium sp. WCA-178-WT-4B]|uniref:SdpI family protein n=1 Tax=Bifidobacterium sp. WCA-178-WT-4B TaxID=2605776 RepID=UPI001E3F0CE0|nr:SdpI family protein [Bifidobacterium sp. WCA-178-WT-4B]
MSSEDTWNRTHKQYAPIFLVDACALFLIALEIIIGGGPWRRASTTRHRRY